METRRICGDKKRADTLVLELRLRIGKNNRDIRNVPVRDPHFLTIQDLFSAIFARGALHACYVGTCLGLCQTICPYHFPTRKSWQVFSFLVGCTPLKNTLAHQTRMYCHETTN